jgi:hypothetical protein
MTQEALKLALEALDERVINEYKVVKAIVAIKEALALQALHSENERLGLYKDAYAQPEQEPVAWLLTDKNINSLQVDSIQRLIDRLKHAHHTDLCVRINGQDEWFQADWLKHMVRVTPPQRTEQNFCSRCGKRLGGIDSIHTCTPPMENTHDARG